MDKPLWEVWEAFDKLERVKGFMQYPEYAQRRIARREELIAELERRWDERLFPADQSPSAMAAHYRNKAARLLYKAWSMEQRAKENETKPAP